jgi:nucleotide-binding universal stress UspA family protein
MTRIVVGVDGSAHSRRALRRAMEEGALRNGTVDVVYAYDRPRRPFLDDLVGLPRGVEAAMGTISPDEPSHEAPTPAEVALTRAERRLEQFVDEAIKGIPGPKPNLIATPADHPAAVLIEESRSADLLVIGTRGLGGLAGMLLGSVAHQCIQRSHCPLLVLPPGEE